MKATESKTTATQTQDQKLDNQPFFSSEEQHGVFSLAKPFFSAGGQSSETFFKPHSPIIQTKLTIDAPDDVYEKEADEMADKAVQRSSIFDSNAEPPDDGIQRKPNGEMTASPEFSSRLSSSKGGGSSLSDGTRAKMENTIGADFSNVRVHTGREASDMSNDIHAQAFTNGSDVYFNEGKYSPESTEGQHLLAHELTHTVQQGGASVKKGGGQGFNRMQQITASPKHISRFAQGSTSVKKENGKEIIDGSGHALMTEHALQGMGLNADQARKGRMGNWERDFSQLFTPGTVALLKAENIPPLLNIVAIKEFGRGIDLQEFGTYDPVEHIDNPTDLRGSDVFAQGTNLTEPTNPDFGSTTYLEMIAGEKNVGYANEDKRYANTPTKGKIMNPKDAAAFQVDETGVPRYMNTSKTWLTAKLHQAAKLGRGNKMEKGTKKGLGPREFSSGIHTMQDYYAHSNFCEIALNILIKNKETGLGVITKNKKGAIAKPFGQGQVLDTQIHKNREAGAGVDMKNLSYNGREVMTTGSFNLTDTAASLLEELQDKIKGLNPFSESDPGPSQTVMACLDYMEMNKTDPTDFTGLGKQIAAIIRTTYLPIRGMVSIASGTTATAGKLTSGAIDIAGSATSGLFSGLNMANQFLGGDPNYFDKEKRGGQIVAGVIGNSIENSSAAIAFKIEDINTQLESVAASMENQAHLGRRIYAWMSGNSPVKTAKKAARKIPIVGESINLLIEKIEAQISQMVAATLGEAWNKTIDIVVDKINKIIEKIRQQTNIQKKKAKAGTGIQGKLGGVADLYDAQGNPMEGIAPGYYSPPSHTEIAKDHDDVQNPVPDGKADGPNEGDEHGHNHISNYLASLAVKLAELASNAIGKPVAACWDIVDKGKGELSEADLKKIDEVVNEYFAHPADCTFWEVPFKTELGKKGDIAKEVQKKLKPQMAITATGHGK